MAKMFYTKEEVLEKLGKTEDQVKEMVLDGKLREFRDGNKLMFKVDEVDNLAVDDLDLSPTDDLGASGELNLDGTSPGLGLSGDSGSQIGLASMDTGSQLGLSPDGQDMSLSAEDMSLETGSAIGLAPSETGSIIGLAPGDTADQVSLDDHSALSKGKDDTVVTSHGEESVASSESGSAVMSDPLVGGDMPEPDFADELNLDGGGSGSGLLDLSREADDTSLGAELLDEIYPEPGEDLSEPKPSRLEVQTTTGTETSESVTSSDQSVLVAASTAGPAETVRVVRVYDDSSAVFGAAMIVPFIMLIYAAMVMIAGVLDIQPSLIKTINSKIWFVTGGAGVLTVLVLAIGLAITHRSPQPAGAKSKAKPTKKAKPVKEKKVKKAKK